VAKPKVFVAPAGKLQEQLFPPRVREALAAFADPIYNSKEGHLTAADLAAQASDCEAIITGWGSPKLDAEILDAAKKLRIVSHAAGSVKFLLPEQPADFFRRGLRMSCATPMMSRYVAELSLCLAIAALRRISQFREELKGSDMWWGTHHPLYPDTLIEQRVGMIGLGLITWEFVRLVKPFGCELWCHSKHGDRERAAAEGIKMVELDDLLRECPIICLFAAVRPDTIGMISREKLKLIQDGAVIVNTARGILIDEAALIDELKTGRLWAGLDVTYPEPPPADNPLRDMPNVLLTPHVGGPTPSRYWEMGAFAVEDLRRFYAGEPLRGEVTEKRLEGMA
jgi:phosphoglycerate dehydrogenase-like enzyme